jgi:formate dehydrogenase major subunit
MKLTRRQSQSSKASTTDVTMNRRAFLRQSGLASGAVAISSTLPLSMLARAEQQTDPDSLNTKQSGSSIESIRTVCSHCSVGCGVIAEVDNGVWIGQEPAFDHPISLGEHCANALNFLKMDIVKPEKNKR